MYIRSIERLDVWAPQWDTLRMQHTYLRQLHLRHSADVSTPVQQYLIKLLDLTKTSDHFDNVWIE